MPSSPSGPGRTAATCASPTGPRTSPRTRNGSIPTACTSTPPGRPCWPGSSPPRSPNYSADLSEIGRHLLDDQVEALELLGAAAEREVGDDHFIDADVTPALDGLDQPLGVASDGRAGGDAL